jgi:hypothetical protein
MNQKSGKTLIQNYDLNYDELMTLILRRESENKTLLEYAIETKTIKPDILIKILNHQNQNQCTFQESLQDLLGEAFTKKYLKLYSAQIPSLHTVWSDQAPFIKKLTKVDHKNGKPDIYNLILDSQSQLSPLDNQSSSSNLNLKENPITVSRPNPGTHETTPTHIPTPPKVVKIDPFESEDEDDFEISAYEDINLVGKQNLHQEENLVSESLVKQNVKSIPSSDLLDELDISESKVLKELTSAEKSTSGFQLPVFPNETIDKSLLSDFLEFFDDHQRNTIETLILSAHNKTGKELSYVFNSLYREFHSLKGSSRFCKLKLFEMITHYLEDLITDVQQKMANFDKSTREHFEESLLLGMDLLWNLKIHIQENNSEKSIPYNLKWINQAHHLWIAIAKTRFNLRFSAAS